MLRLSSRLRGLVGGILLLFVIAGPLAAQDIYAEVRWRTWVTLYHDARFTELLASTEQDLRLGKPHPMVARVWYAALRALGRFPAEAGAKADSPLKAALGVMPEIMQANVDDSGPAVLERLPPSAAASLSPYELIVLSGLALDDQPLRAFDYLALAARKAPDMRYIAWNAVMAWRSDAAAAADLEAARDRLLPQLSPELAGLLKPLLVVPKPTKADEAVAIEAWLAHHPDDPEAAQYRAQRLFELDDDEAVVKAGADLFRLNPFRNAMNLRATALTRLGRRQEVPALVDQSWPTRFSGQDPEQARAEAMIDVLRWSGERLADERAIKTALARWPDDLQLMRQLMWLESNNNRWRHEADAALKILAVKPTEQSTYNSLIYALEEAKDVDGVMHARTAYLAAGGKESTATIINTVSALLVADRLQEALDIATSALASRPRAIQLAGNQAEVLRRLDRTDDAIAAFKALFAWHAPTEWQAARYIEALEQAGQDVEREFARLRAAWPRSVSVWKATETWLAKRDPDRSLRRKLWESAVQIAPEVGDYWVALAELDKDADPAKALEVLKGGLAATAGSLPSQRAAVLISRVQIGTEALETHKLDATPEFVAELMGQLDETAKLHQPLGAYHRARARLFAVQQKPDEVRKETIAWAVTDPDSMLAVFELCSGNVKGLERHGPDGFGRVARIVERMPYNGSVLRDSARLHALYGGSPLMVLRIQRQADEAELTAEDRADLDDLVNNVWKLLGDGQRHYRESYAKRSGIAPSDRYVGWFDYAREAARRPATVVQSIDLDDLSVTARLADGMEVKARWDPVTAGMTYFSVGAAWVSAAYDPVDHRLRMIWNSAGQFVWLGYDSQGRASEYHTPDGYLLLSDYDENGKARRMEVPGVGVIVATYRMKDGKSEVEKVERQGALNTGASIATIAGDVTRYVGALASADFSNPPDLPFTDSEHDRLEDAFDSADSRADKIRTALDLVRYRVDHLADRLSYAQSAEKLATETWMATRSEDDEISQLAALQAMTLWHDLQGRLRPDGLPPKPFKQWSDMTNWLAGLTAASAVADKNAAAVRAAIKAQPLALLAGHEWLPRSYIDNNGFWQRTAIEAVVPRDKANHVLPRAALIRRNGDLVVGSNVGLLVRRGGYWRWYGFDEAQRGLVMTPKADALRASSDVQALAEDGAGRLWIGTAGGLLRLDGEDPAGPVQWITDGLPAPRIGALAAWKSGVLVGTAQGLAAWSDAGKQPLPPTLADWSKREVSLLRSLSAKNDRLLLGGGDGAVMLAGEAAVALGPDRPVDGVWQDAEDRLLLLYPDRLEARGEAPGDKPRRIAGLSDLTQGRRVTGIGLVPLRDRDEEDHELVPAIASDSGLVFYREGHFETKKLPFADRIAGVQLLAARDDGTFVVSEAGLYELQYRQIVQDRKGRVQDLLVDEAQGLTFVARGDSLEAVHHDAIDKGAQPFDGVSARRLAFDRQGRLVTNDGDEIIRYTQGSKSAEELFSVRPSHGGPFQRLGSLLVASDGTIWATYGASLFRWREGDKKAEEFSTYLDPKRFPGRTDAVSRVLETVDGKIWVVASDESHIKWQGQPLKGGLLQWDGAAFHQLDEMREGRWFISAYTPIGDGSAIVGTTGGFARHRGNLYASFESSEDQSYLALKQRNYQLFLGTRGAKIAGADSSTPDIWLFGTAGGLVAYQGGRWFMPDRLNWMLPDQHLAQYGSRTVHAVAVDHAGRVYAGTDAGLTIYDSGGGDPVDFLTSNRMSDLAFNEIEEQKQRQQADVLRAAVSPQSKAGRAYARYDRINRRIDRLREQMSGGVRLGSAAPVPTPSGADQGRRIAGAETASGQAVRKQLAQAERAKRQLLEELTSDPVLRGELNPLDLVAMRKQLPERDVVIQLLPTQSSLHINLVRRDGMVETRVDVTREELYKKVTLVGDALADRIMLDPAELQSHLHTLYDWLLAPVEGQLDGSNHVYITGIGPLAYLPFGALVRTAGAQPEYAVSRWNIGYIPTLYLLQGLRRDPGGQERTLILADPDGRLKGANNEARTLYSRLPRQTTDLKVGPDATVESLKELGPDARLIHFGTHALLDTRDPARSYLVLANKSRLTAADIVSLDLSRTDLVVLSACETGVGGKDGLEFATLARAFAHAGVPSVLATLWKVNDTAASRLIQAFYKAYSDDSYAALAAAQRDLIKAGGALSAPSAWAGFVPFGRP
jgi:CHAT domain-containing protein/ligand-binding sensor domain-containing protein